MTNATLISRTKMRAEKISNRLDCAVINIPTCYIRKQLANDEEFQQYAALREYVPPLKARDALFGGHVNSYKLLCRAGDDYDIDYIGKLHFEIVSEKNDIVLKISYPYIHG